MTEPTEDHSHNAIGGVIVGLFAVLTLVAFASLLQAHQLNVIYDRVGEMQRQIDCPSGELFVTDHDGVEYCLDPAEER